MSCVLATLVLFRICGMIAARRAKSAGSRLHLRLTGVFAIIALVPTILVAVFAGLTLNVGLEGWFSRAGARAWSAPRWRRRRPMTANSAADLTEDAEALAHLLDAQRRTIALMTDGDFRLAGRRGRRRSSAA